VPQYALGRQPADPTRPKLRLRRSATARPEPPASCDWLSRIDQWDMLANDSVGDCTMAGAAHVAMAVDKYGQDRDLRFTDEQALAAYSALTGYNPADPSTDTGATLQDALDYWRKTGLEGNTITAAAQLDPQDLDLVRACIAIFGSVYTGFWVTSAAMDQFDHGDPWTTTGRSRNLGGHCVPILGYDEDSFTCVTWGQTQKMSLEFFSKYFDEVWAPVDLDWLRVTGTSPAGIDIAALNADYELLTGQTGPFPPMVVPPAPTPDPVPEPIPEGNPDADLVSAFVRWQAAKGLL
jgi:hypothetical protein